MMEARLGVLTCAEKGDQDKEVPDHPNYVMLDLDGLPHNLDENILFHK